MNSLPLALWVLTTTLSSFISKDDDDDPVSIGSAAGSKGNGKGEKTCVCGFTIAEIIIRLLLIRSAREFFFSPLAYLKVYGRPIKV